MAYYLVQVAYTAETLKTLLAKPQDRTAAIRPAVEKLGGKICMEKTAVPEMGYFVVCQDTENNTFALWERNEKAK